MQDWWNTLSLEQQIFYSIGILSTFIVLIQTALMLFTGDGGDGGDIDIPDASDVTGDATPEHPGDLHVLSTRTVTAFFVGFGWTGVICLKRNLSFELAVLLSLLAGLIFMFVIFYLMKGLYSLRASGNVNYANAIGQIGTVYIPIPPQQSAPGQVELLIQGRIRFVQAFTNHSEKIPSNSRVKIVGMIDQGTLMVEPLEGHSTREGE